MTSSTLASSVVPRRIALRTSPSVTSPSSRCSPSTTSAICCPLRVIASSARRSVEPSGTSTSPSRGIVSLTLLDHPGVERRRAQDLHDARGGPSVAVRIGQPLEPPAEAGRQRRLDALEDLVAPGLDVDDVDAAEAAPLPAADVHDRQPERGRLDEPAR